VRRAETLVSRPVGHHRLPIRSGSSEGVFGHVRYPGEEQLALDREIAELVFRAHEEGVNGIELRSDTHPRSSDERGPGEWWRGPMPRRARI